MYWCYECAMLRLTILYLPQNKRIFHEKVYIIPRKLES